MSDATPRGSATDREATTPARAAPKPAPGASAPAAAAPSPGPDTSATGAEGLIPATGSPAPSTASRATAPSSSTPSGFDRTQRKVEGPRRVRNGIKLKRKEGLETLPALANRWLDLVQGRASLDTRLLGLEYAIAGQVASFAILPGAVEALVQGRAPRPYAVRIESRVLDRAEWDTVIGAMAQEALFAAKLLAGELPSTIEEPFRAAGRPLVPEDASEVVTTCACEEKQPCKHVAAVAILAAERIEVDPQVLLTLRGLPTERLLERLQETRSRLTAGGGSGPRAASPVSAGRSVIGASPLPPIESCLHDYWRPGRQLADFESAPAGHHAPHALLRRLGPSPLGGRFPLVGLLASAYDTIRAAGLRWQEEGDAP